MSPTVGVIGAAGFFGWHLRCRLATFGGDSVAADRTTFSDQDALDRFVEAADVVVHIAGVNRAHDEGAIVAGNVGLAKSLVDARARTEASFDVIYANTVKAGEPGPYGESKAMAATKLGADATSAGNRFVDIRFPHLFGEFGVPHYNSGVTTFAHQLARGEESTVNDGQLELLHAQDASQIILDAIDDQRHGPLRPPGREITVPDCYATMARLAEPYVAAGVVPHIGDEIGAGVEVDEIDDQFELRLFNTIRSQMWPDAYPMQLTKHADQRGAFFEVVRAWGQGQTSISTTVPGVIRGEHFHFDKVERFAVISGQARIRVRRLFTDQAVIFDVSGDDPVFIDMPPLCTHDITNTGSSELVTLFWSHDHFDPAKADTYPMKVVAEDGEALPA
ncbi:MAG: NAD-dependent epimerase/dehydratase family protein [Acidimicrobiales bacterium]